MTTISLALPIPMESKVIARRKTEFVKGSRLASAVVLLCATQIAAALGFVSYEASVKLENVLATKAILDRAATEAAKKIGYAESKDLGSAYTVPSGYIRLMAFEATKCVDSSDFKCPKDPTYVPAGYVFVERDEKTGVVVVRSLKWCSSTCAERVKTIATDFSKQMANSVSAQLAK